MPSAAACLQPVRSTKPTRTERVAYFRRPRSGSWIGRPRVVRVRLIVEARWSNGFAGRHSRAAGVAGRGRADYKNELGRPLTSPRFRRARLIGVVWISRMPWKFSGVASARSTRLVAWAEDRRFGDVAEVTTPCPTCMMQESREPKPVLRPPRVPARAPTVRCTAARALAR